MTQQKKKKGPENKSSTRERIQLAAISHAIYEFLTQSPIDE